MEILTHCRIATPQNFILKFGTCNDVRDMTSHANFGADLFGGEFSPNTWNIALLWLFLLSLLFSQSSPQITPRHWCKRLMAQTTCFCTRRCLLGVRITGDAIWGKYAPKQSLILLCNNVTKLPHTFLGENHWILCSHQDHISYYDKEHQTHCFSLPENITQYTHSRKRSITKKNYRRRTTKKCTAWDGSRWK